LGGCRTGNGHENDGCGNNRKHPMPRLSITPVTPAQWKIVEKLAAKA
jgi:predicted RNA-binding protein with PUA-like domain